MIPLCSKVCQLLVWGEPNNFLGFYLAGHFPGALPKVVRLNYERNFHLFNK